MQKLKNTSRRRLPFVFLAGSPLGPRVVDGMPNEVLHAAPQNPMLRVPVQIDQKALLDSWRQETSTNERLTAASVLGLDLESEKVLTLDDVVPVARLKCPHGIWLTMDEMRLRATYKRKYHTFKSRPKSFECIDCHPVCIHGISLTAAEKISGKRFSMNCFECNTTIQDPAKIEIYLAKQKLSPHHGMALHEGEVVTSYGLRITKSGQNYVQGGGSKDIEQTDAQHVDVVDTGDETIAVQSGGPDRDGYGPDSAEDHDGETVDELGDPISYAPSETVGHFERARTEATEDFVEALKRVSYEIRRDEVKGVGWIATADDVEIGKYRTKDEAKTVVRDLQELDRLNFRSDKQQASIEHSIQDVTTTDILPDSVGQLKGMGEQNVNKDIWKKSETANLQKDVADEIEKFHDADGAL